MKVLIIHSLAFTKPQILDDLREEEFKHEFLFVQDSEDSTKALLECDEVWTFGDLGNTPIILEALDMGCDLWKMG
jgi:hypothetical protein